MCPSVIVAALQGAQNCQGGGGGGMFGKFLLRLDNILKYFSIPSSAQSGEVGTGRLLLSTRKAAPPWGGANPCKLL